MSTQLVTKDGDPIPPGPIVRVSNEDSPLTVIARVAAGGATLEVIEKLKGLVEWDDARKAKAEFNAAFSAAKGLFKKANKSGYNGHLRSHYSTLEDYDEASREPLTTYGLSWRHVVATEGNMTRVKCILAHKSGHSEECELQAVSESMTNNAVNKLQSLGIVVMYLKRITLSSILGMVSTEDDNDGEGGEGHEKISATQVLDLNAKITEVGVDVVQFKKFLKLDRLEDLLAKNYDAAIQALNDKAKGVRK